MFSSVESLATNRANHRLVASSIILISNILSPRPSNQAWSLVSHCTNSPKRLRRSRHAWIFSVAAYALATAWPGSSTSAPFPAHLDRCFLARYSEASVGPNPRYTGSLRIATASRCFSRPPCGWMAGLATHAPRPCRPLSVPAAVAARVAQSSPCSSAACFCVIFLLGLFRGHQRSRSA